jgi:hypothetical protein
MTSNDGYICALRTGDPAILIFPSRTLGRSMNMHRRTDKISRRWFSLRLI